ncbi:hypothetical protein PENSTE_c019G02612 [Penicillium steckii]|uniref:CHAT domain-containing protein n=1 Tax=Penicillium steckii TaxID=303698 RepID=A0A1V6SW60_9EURO|nr:hypothetical protein PENSTE_c019G02612 [Penicillium steckii]
MATDSPRAEIPESTLNAANEAFSRDRPITQDLIPGDFFDDPNYLRTLPHNAKALICAVQHLGDHPDRPGLCHIQSEQAFARYIQFETEDELNMAFALEALSLRYVPESHPGRGKSNHHMGTLYQRRWKNGKNTTDLDKAIRYYALAIDFAQETDEILREWACDLAVVYMQRYKQAKQPADKEKASTFFDKAIELARESPVRARHLSNKGEFLYQFRKDDADKIECVLTDSIKIHDDAIEICDSNPGLSSPPHLPYGMIHRNAALAYQARYAINNQVEDGVRAITLINKALTFQTVHDQHWEGFTRELAELEELHAKIQGHSEPSQKACDVWRDAMKAFSDAIEPKIGLVKCLEAKAEKLVDSSSAMPLLQEAKDVLDNLNDQLPSGHRDSGLVSSCCASLYQSLYDVSGDSSHIDKAIDFAQKSTQDQTSTDLSARYRLLSIALMDRYDKNSGIQDLIAATGAATTAFAKCRQGDNIEQASSAWVVAKTSRKFYDFMPNPELLQKTCMAFKMTAELMPKDYTYRPLALNDLGHAYSQLFVHDALPEHLENAIKSYEEALAQLGSEDDGERSRDFFMISAALGGVMVQRFLHWRSEADIESAVKYFKKSMSPIDNQTRRFGMRAANLIYALQLRFEAKRDVNDLKESQKIALAALEGPVDLGDNLRANLGTSIADTYQLSFKITSQLADLENSIRHYDKAIASIGTAGPSYRGILLVNKAMAQYTLAEKTGKESDFQATEVSLQQAYGVVTESNPLYWTVVQKQAQLRYNNYKRRLGPESIEDASKALENYERYSRNTALPVSDRIPVASIAAQIANDVMHDPIRARNNILICLELLPEAISMHENRLTQLKFVRQYQYVPGSAAALSLFAGDHPSTAIQRLESGRAFIWDRIQGQPTELDTLELQQPDLIKRFRTLQQRVLQKSNSPDTSSGDRLAFVSASDEKRLKSHSEADAYRQTLEEIRSLPGFGSFLRTSEAPTDLQLYAKDAPIVFINASSYRSDAVILTSNGIDSISLPGFNVRDVKSYTLRFAVALYSLGKEEDRAQALCDYKTIMKWLWEVAAKPIMESIDWKNYQKSASEKPRIIWVSAGWISALPIHAAGDFEEGTSSENEEPRCVHDIAVSSYTNSLKALSYIRKGSVDRKSSPSRSNPQVLVAAMAQTPGLGSAGNLNVHSEIDSIQKALAANFDVKVLMQPDTPSVKSTISQDTAILHFACHARADDKDPSRSAIMLQDWQAKSPPLSVRTLLNLDLKSCELVYLSACESGASKDILLRDEGIHIAGGFHIAGVSHVISTLWKVSDDISSELSGIFYTNLQREGQDCPDLDRAPFALHNAISVMRQKGVHPMLWGAFIHSGP